MISSGVRSCDSAGFPPVEVTVTASLVLLDEADVAGVVLCACPLAQPHSRADRQGRAAKAHHRRVCLMADHWRRPAMRPMDEPIGQPESVL